MIPKFTIFYNDDSEVHGGGDEDEIIYIPVSKAWLLAPSDGVSHINIEHSEIGRATLKENDYYFMFPLDSHGNGLIAASQKLGAFFRQGLSIVKFGGWTDPANYKRIANKAIHDTWVPRVSGKIPVNDEDKAD